MPIAFFKEKAVKRKDNKNSCHKAAYNSRSSIYFEGNKFQNSTNYNFSWKKEDNHFHIVLLPEGADKKFLDPKILWNEAEKCELRSNSQVARECVAGLPDDLEVSDLDRINLITSYAKENYVKHGVAVQIDIHYPLDESGNRHNCHAHLLMPTRYFSEDGKSLGKKARDLDPEIATCKTKSGSSFVKVVDYTNTGKVWGNFQNKFFEEKGLSLRVDPISNIPQKHLGPVRLRATNEGIIENSILKDLNRAESSNPFVVLKNITKLSNAFTFEDVENYLAKHGDPSDLKYVREEFWNQSEIIPLLNEKTNEPIGKFTTKEVIQEEEKILRLAQKIQKKAGLKIKTKKPIESYIEKLNTEQKNAFDKITKGNSLSLIEGYAGTGKSYLISSLESIYKDSKYAVRVFGPDRATVELLKKGGFESARTIHNFLYSEKFSKLSIDNKKEVWILDEAGKLGNQAFLELLKLAEKSKVQVILCGDSNQLPSIDRGGMFSAFSKNFGSAYLKDIQRQKNPTQLNITKNLAYGKFNQAISEIAHVGGTIFSKNKSSAIESLMKQWAADRYYFPGESSLLIANSYHEIYHLNSLVREYLKREGAIGSQEYKYFTPYGSILVSSGDRIEFRKKDVELGVNNGTEATVIDLNDKLIKAQYKNDKGFVQEIEFNPKEYTNFNLAYSKTYNRSQGHTCDRTYVLNSKYMNKERFYVSATRHKSKVTIFSSESEARNIADLKLQVRKSEIDTLVSHYTTEEKLQNQLKVFESDQKIEKLKSSDSIVSNIKGFAIENWRFVTNRLNAFIQDRADLKPNNKFYDYFPEPNLKANRIISEEIQGRTNIENIQREIKEQTPIKKTNKPEKPSSWSHLTEIQKSQIKAYFELSEKSEVLYGIVKSEKEGSFPVLHEHDWKKSCSLRNEQAYLVSNSIPKESLSKAIGGKKGFEILMDRSNRHREYLNRSNQTHFDLEANLKDNIETLLHRLFPEGPSKKDSRGLRFGSKGSLSVTLVGEKAGTYYDFSKEEGGGLINLISKTLGLERKEAMNWAREFVQSPGSIEIPKKFKESFSDKYDDWISLKPPQNQKAPTLKELSPVMEKIYNEIARYPYINEKGELLFYILRLSERTDSSKKVIRPLSYGRHEGDENSKWSLKGYKDDHKRPLYNLPSALANPSATILIVEGEKTAEAAKKICEKDKICCVTWSGGASAVSKADWSVLVGRNVIIWPDNDKAGFKASEDICHELRKIGVGSLNVISSSELSNKFPLKWDLADALPDGKTVQDIRDMMLNAQSKSVAIDSISVMLNKSNSLENHVVNKLMTNEILWRVEERLRPILEEQKDLRDWEVKDTIKNEVSSILSSRESVQLDLESKYHIPSSMLEPMTFGVLIHKAKTGELPQENDIKHLRELVSRFDISHEKYQRNEINAFALKKSVANYYTALISGGMNRDELQKMVDQTASQVKNYVISNESNQRNQQLQMGLE